MLSILDHNVGNDVVRIVSSSILLRDVTVLIVALSSVSTLLSTSSGKADQNSRRLCTDHNQASA